MSEQSLVCTVCPNGCNVTVITENSEIVSVTGNKCKRGDAYARAETTNPVRTLAALVQVEGGEFAMCPVRTDKPVPKDLLRAIAKEAMALKIKAPIIQGSVLIKNVLGTGADLIATRSVEKA